MATLAPPCIKEADAAAYAAKPMVDGRKFLLNGEVLSWDGPVQEVFAPIYKVANGHFSLSASASCPSLDVPRYRVSAAQEEGSKEQVLIGYQARFNEEQSLKALDAATASWNHGRGVWAQTSPAGRIAKVEELVMLLKPKRDEVRDVPQHIPKEQQMNICTRIDNPCCFDCPSDHQRAHVGDLQD